MTTSQPARGSQLDRTALAARIEELGPWFQNLQLGELTTAPTHYLGNYPSDFFQYFSHAIPADLTGWSVLDIGCNAGFYSFEMKRRGASRVLGIDHDPRYLQQARFAAEVLGLDVQFEPGDVYDVAALRERFDLVLFTGVLYHLRHPLLALDLLRRTVVGRMLVFQSMQRGPADELPLERDYPFSERQIFEHRGYPVLHFVEGRYAEDQTNWWIPNRACAEAMLRSAGFTIQANPVVEVYVCAPDAAVTPSLPGPLEATLRD